MTAPASPWLQLQAIESIPLCARIGRLLCASVLAVGAGQAVGIVDLAALDGASGDEARVIRYIQDRLAGIHRIGGNNTLVATFGSGSPSTLLLTGIDEPGYAVSGIHEEGYLQVRPLAGAPLASGLEKHFLGKHVNVSTRTGTILPGVIAAPSVHFDSVRRFRNRNAQNALLIDIGAQDSFEVARAGVAVLDRVTLHKEPAILGDGWVSAPWISSRSGAAVLLNLARRLERSQFPGTVAIAFVTQMHYHNAGLSRVLASVDADRVILLAANGSSKTSVSAVAGSGSDLVGEIAELAASATFPLERNRPETLSFGPFGNSQPWKIEQRMAVLKCATRNRGTPAEAVQPGELDRLAVLLASLVGANRLAPAPEPLSSALPQPTDMRVPAGKRESLLARSLRPLIEAAGVSGDESRVRELLASLLPEPNPPSYSVDSDERGNLIARLGNGANTSAVFMAHMDEIGFTVRRITSRGELTADSKGGGTPSLFEWQPAAVHGSYGSLAAVMTRGGSLDLGQTTGDAVRAMGVREGDSVTVPKRYRNLLGRRVAARSLDDRLGCAVLVEAVRRLVRPARRATGSVEFVFTVEEETGLKGAKHFAETSTPSRVFPVDTFVTSDSPLESRDLAYARLGAGPVLRALDESGMTPRSEIARVFDLARRHGIPLQVGATAGGNDGSVFRSLDTVNIPIGFPLRYAHTPVETADLRDAEAAVDLIEMLALEELRNR